VDVAGGGAVDPEIEECGTAVGPAIVVVGSASVSDQGPIEAEGAVEGGIAGVLIIDKEVTILADVALACTAGAKLASHVANTTGSCGEGDDVLSPDSSAVVHSLVAEVVAAGGVLLPEVVAARAGGALVVVLVGAGEAVLVAEVADVGEAQVGRAGGCEDVGSIAGLTARQPEVEVGGAAAKDALVVGVAVTAVEGEILDTVGVVGYKGCVADADHAVLSPLVICAHAAAGVALGAEGGVGGCGGDVLAWELIAVAVLPVVGAAGVAGIDVVGARPPGQPAVGASVFIPAGLAAGVGPDSVAGAAEIVAGEVELSIDCIVVVIVPLPGKVHRPAIPAAPSATTGIPPAVVAAVAATAVAIVARGIGVIRTGVEAVVAVVPGLPYHVIWPVESDIVIVVIVPVGKARPPQPISA
jgi:hypothetical protein